MNEPGNTHIMNYYYSATKKQQARVHTSTFETVIPSTRKQAARAHAICYLHRNSTKLKYFLVTANQGRPGEGGGGRDE